MRKIIILLVLVSAVCSTQAQRSSDTTALIKELNDVMSFAVQPYLHYSSVISLRRGPMVDTAGTGTVLHNEFYKVQDDLYYGNEQEEIYLQDSLMVRISHARKMIQLSRVDVSTKKRIDLMPLKRADMQRLMREHCTLSGAPGQGDTDQIVIRSQEKQAPQGLTSSEMAVTYRRDTHLPVLMELSMHVRQDETEEMVELLKTQGFDVGKMEVEQDGKKTLGMTQTASVSFEGIEMTKEKAMGMPVWTAQVGYDDQSKNFSGKGRCEGYEVIKTF